MNHLADQRLGTTDPRLTIYIPHLPAGMEQLIEHTSVTALLACNSNHWRKIITLGAKVAAPDPEWQQFRDLHFFKQVALVFSPTLENSPGWHWIGGKDNQSRFGLNSEECLQPTHASDLFIDPVRRLLLTPYPDYRQLSNLKVGLIREALQQHGFYA